MDALATLDTLILEAGKPDAGVLSDELAARASELAAALMEALLAQNTGLRALDDLLYPEPHEKSARRVAQSVSAAWRRWTDDAALLLDRLDRLPAPARDGGSSSRVARACDLGDAYGRAMAMLQMTPERVDRAREQARRGEVVSIEEVRRELRAGAHR